MTTETGGAKILPLAVALVACCGCRSASEPAEVVTVELVSANASAGGASDIRIDAAWIVRNVSGDSITYLPCRTVIERLHEGAWVGVWGRSCVGSREPQLTIPGHSVRNDSMTVEFSRAPAGQPQWYYGPIAGTYRMRVALMHERGHELPPNVRSTVPFVLAEVRP